MKQILKWVIISGLFLALALPLYVSNSLYFPFIAGKSFAFRIITEIIFAAWVVLMLLDKRYAPKRSWILWGYSAFMVIITIADIFGVNPYRSFWSNYERMEGLVEHLHLFAYFLVAACVLQTERLWDAFWKTALGVTLIMTVYGFVQLAGKATIDQGGTRLDGTLGNAAYMAIYMFFGMAIAALLLVQTKVKWQKWAYGAVIIAEAIVLYYTETRGTILGLLAALGLVALLIAIFGKNNRMFRKTAIGGIIAVVVVVGGFYLIRNTSFVQKSPVLSRFATISLTERTTVSRFTIWNMAWQGFKERPILGWGQENFNYVFSKYYDPSMYDQEQWFDRTHDVFFDWLIAGGIFGLASYLFLFGAMVRAIWKRSRFSLLEKSLLSGLLVGYFVHNLFVFDNFTSYLLFFSLAAYLHSMTVYAGGDEKADEAAQQIEGGPLINPEITMYGIAPVAGVVAVLLVYFLNVRPIDAGQTLVDALQIESSGPAQELATYQKAIGYNTFGDGEIRERLVLDAPTFSASLQPADQSKILSYAKDQMQIQIAGSHEDARYLLFMGSFLDRLGQSDEALGYLKRAEAASPKKQSILIEEGVAYLGKQDFADALGEFKKASDLAPGYTDAKIIYAIGALYDKNTQLADSILSGIDPKIVAADDRLLSTYSSLGMYDKVLAVWQARVAADPKNAQNRLSLAATLLKLNRRPEAIAQLQAIIASNPNYATQIQGYIDQIKAGKNPV